MTTARCNSAETSGNEAAISIKELDGALEPFSVTRSIHRMHYPIHRTCLVVDRLPTKTDVINDRIKMPNCVVKQYTNVTEKDKKTEGIIYHL